MAMTSCLVATVRRLTKCNIKWKRPSCTIEGRLGDDPQDLKQARILNRVVTWESWGIRYEADPRHAEVPIRELDIQPKEQVVTPGVKWNTDDMETAKPLDDSKATQYRTLAARAYYLA